jgi:hypothetical protein
MGDHHLVMAEAEFRQLGRDLVGENLGELVARSVRQVALGQVRNVVRVAEKWDE